MKKIFAFTVLFLSCNIVLGSYRAPKPPQGPPLKNYKTECQCNKTGVCTCIKCDCYSCKTKLKALRPYKCECVITGKCFCGDSCQCPACASYRVKKRTSFQYPVYSPPPIQFIPQAPVFNGGSFGGGGC